MYLGYDKLSIQSFRNKIIAKLRDNEVIISSSSSGYKIPSTEKELYDFVNHGKSIIMPMLHRLKICNDVIRNRFQSTSNYIRKQFCMFSLSFRHSQFDITRFLRRSPKGPAISHYQIICHRAVS